MGAAFVQETFGSSTTTPITCAAITVTAGNAIAGAAFQGGNTRIFNSLADGLGNAFTLLDNPTSTTNYDGAMFYSPLTVSGSSAVAMTMSGNANVYVCLHEVSGVSATPLDVHALAAQNAPGTAANDCTSGNVTPSADGAYLFGAIGTSLAGENSVVTAGTTIAWTARGTPFPHSNAGVKWASESFVQTTAAAIAATFGSATSSQTLTGIIALKAAGGAPAGTIITGLGRRMVSVIHSQG